MKNPYSSFIKCLKKTDIFVTRHDRFLGDTRVTDFYVTDGRFMAIVDYADYKVYFNASNGVSYAMIEDGENIHNGVPCATDLKDIYDKYYKNSSGQIVDTRLSYRTKDGAVSILQANEDVIAVSGAVMDSIGKLDIMEMRGSTFNAPIFITTRYGKFLLLPVDLHSNKEFASYVSILKERKVA